VIVELANALEQQLTGQNGSIGSITVQFQSQRTLGRNFGRRAG
jgi:hypothetical protein